MARNNGAQEGSQPTQKRSRLAGHGLRLKGSWWDRNWHTVVILATILFIAFFVRTYFGYSLSVDNGYLVSGGSDSYYHERVIQHVMGTGEHLVQDPLLNYPNGMRNARPPLYDWSVAVGASLLSYFTEMTEVDAMGMVLVLSTAFWGALTVIPVYLMGRAAFGDKAGLIAAFLFAIMPGHIQRSVMSNADHDAMVLFFAVWGFYFLLMALLGVRGERWVSSWRERGSIVRGIRSYLGQNQLSVLYAMLGGVCIAAVAMIWTGFAYLVVIILGYFLVQLFVNLFKKMDSMGVMIMVAVFLGTAFLVMAPVYWQMNYWNTWFDVPVYLFLGSMLVGIIFVLTRDYPWTIVLPSFITVAAVGMLLLSFFMPDVFDAIATGQGYFIKSKLYSTISEAQSPEFSSLVLSFGMITFWLAFMGVVWAALRVPKNVNHWLIFIVVWSGISMFMAVSAGRFMFNAAPAFAVTAGWITAVIIGKLNFHEIPKAMAGFRGGALGALRKAIKIRHVLGAIFLVLLILVPNVWYAVDAGIPSNDKVKYSQQVYDIMPDFLRPADYDEENGSAWYFGAFSYTLPLPDEYWPSAWSWFKERDSDIYPVTSRPAFLSWWDYGFEAIQEGEHPTVADNFQNAYKFAGSFITCQSEDEAIALMIVRTLDGTGVEENETVRSILEEHGVDVTKLSDIMLNPAGYIDLVLGNPDIYGPYDTELSAQNAKYAAARVELAKIGEETLVSLYHELRLVTDIEIGYLAIDSRLFPFSALGSNILYAPVKLSDHRVNEYGEPIDFYRILAVDQFGNTYYLENVTSDMIIVNYQMEYGEMFYDSMLYRAFMGYGPEDIGMEQQGIPGVSGSLSNYPSMQAWNMTHYRMVYRTGYYNPYPEDLVSEHPKAWRAISYEEGLSLQERIGAGEIEGVVDLSSSVLQAGVVFIQYYEGAIIGGQVVTETGEPFPNAWVTVLDEYGIPHQTVKTDAQGMYEVIAPFGEVDLVFSYGDLDLRTQIAEELTRVDFNITYDQAMRVQADVDHDGMWDYLIHQDVELDGADLSGQVYWDLDGDGELGADDQVISNATVVIQDTDSEFRQEMLVNSTGHYALEGLPAMTAELFAIIGNRSLGTTEQVLYPMGSRTVDIGVRPSSINGTLIYENGQPAVGLVVELRDLLSGEVLSRSCGEQGEFSFDILLPGDYSLSLQSSEISIGDLVFSVKDGETVEKNFTVYEALRITGRATLDDASASGALVGVLSKDYSIWSSADQSGRFDLTVPEGNYTIYCLLVREGVEYVFLDLVSGSDQVSVNPVLVAGRSVSGTVYEDGPMEGVRMEITSDATGAVLTAVTNSTGGYRLVIPGGRYFIYAASNASAVWEDMYLTSSKENDIYLTAGVRLAGKVWYDSDQDGNIDAAEGREKVTLIVSDKEGRAVTRASNSSGAFSFMLMPGEYTLVASVEGYETVIREYDLDQSVSDNIQLIPENRTVSGATTLNDLPLGRITVEFEAVGGDAISASVESDVNGLFTISLSPGIYGVKVDQNVTFSNITRYQNTTELVVNIGSDPAELQLSIVERTRVYGEVTPDRGARYTVVFDGPERREIETDGSFELYLMEGQYDIYASASKADRSYVCLETLYIDTGSSPISLITSDAFSVGGTLVYQDSILARSVPITIIDAYGATLNLTTESTGRFFTALVPGEYTISVDYRLIDDVGLERRYVRYHSSTLLQLIGTTNIDVDLQMELDNSTATGRLAALDGMSVAGELVFTALSETAINASAMATAAGYTLTLAPGNYSLYAREAAGPGAFLGVVEITPYIINEIDVQLVTGLRLGGKTSYAGTEAAAQITIEDQDGGTISLESRTDGFYELYLPSGEYWVNCSASAVERTVIVDYLAALQIDLLESTNKIITLDKEIEAGVEVEWSEQQKMTVSPGGEVVYTLTVINTGNERDSFTLTALGTTWEVELEPSVVSLQFGTQNAQAVTVRIRTSTDALVVHNPITIKVTSSLDTKVSDSTKVDVNILPVRSLNMSKDKVYGTEGANYTISIKLENNGNVEDTYFVSVSNSEQLASLGWTYGFENGTANATQLTVEAGGPSYFDLSLFPTRVNPDPNVEVVLMARSLNESGVSMEVPISIDLPIVLIPDNGLRVTGYDVFGESPTVPLVTVGAAGFAVVMLVIVVLLGMQKGVFRRRKR